MSKASVIIPVYNKEKYLKETLISVDKQTEDDLEIIIIDDASSDNSLNIINDFASNTKKQVRIFKNDTNQGVAYSRNVGIEEAKTDYITFLDADDILNHDFMEVMLNKAKQFPYVDFIRGTMRIVYDGIVVADGKSRNYYENQIIVPSLNTDYIVKETSSSNGRLYNSSFIKNLRFVESSYEDYEFTLDTILSCTSILYTTKAIYNYVFAEDGKNFTESNKYLKTFCDYEEVHDRIFEKHPDISKDMLEGLKKKQIRIYINYLKRISESDMKASDKMILVDNILLYLKYRYDMSDCDIFKIIGRPVFIEANLDESRQKIKEILMKY